jgi:hypothetical protein
VYTKSKTSELSPLELNTAAIYIFVALVDQHYILDRVAFCTLRLTVTDAFLVRNDHLSMHHIVMEITFRSIFGKCRVFTRVGTYVQRGSKFCFVVLVLVVVVVVLVAANLLRILHF